MKRAIVLSGGGSKGAYQIGVWKALRELNIKYDIVTGTSIGALNGALMVQNSYLKAYRLWYSLDYDMVLSNNVEVVHNKQKMLLKYAKGVPKGGLSVSGLEKTIKENINVDKVLNSNIDYGLVTVKFPSLKPIMLTKDKINKDNFSDYLLASSACFPALKMKNIDNSSYIDGGYYDNMPINLAIKLGATEVIAVDLKAVGINKKVKDTNVKVTLITPRNDIGNFLIMDKFQSRKAIRYGYNDTMKVFEKLDGNKYTFLKGSLLRNYKRIINRFDINMSTYIDSKSDKLLYNEFNGKNKYNAFNEILEMLASVFEIDDSIIYRTSYLNTLIKKQYGLYKIESYKDIKKSINISKLSKKYISRELICYMCYEITSKEPDIKIIENLKKLFPNSFLCALYLKSII